MVGNKTMSENENFFLVKRFVDASQQIDQSKCHMKRKNNE